MPTIMQQLKSPLTRAINDRDRVRLESSFPDLSGTLRERSLALRCYLRKRPECYFDVRAQKYYLDWLKSRDERDRLALQSHLLGIAHSLNQALLFLREINAESWHDRMFGSGDDVELLRFVDKTVHPTYLRLAEAVLIPLLKPLAFFSRLDRGKSTEGLSAHAVTLELGVTAAAELIEAHDHVIRNAIAHGGITYLQNDIRYRDDRGNERTLGPREVVGLCDDLLDVCNGLAAGLKIFFITTPDAGYVSLRELSLEELQEETRAPWWNVEACVESELGTDKQLIVYASLTRRDWRKIQWSAVQTGIMAHEFAPGYDRYFLSLHSPGAAAGWAVFDGNRLHELRASGANDLGDYAGAIQSLYLHRRKHRFVLSKVETLLDSLWLHWPDTKEEIRKARAIPAITCRNVTLHRNSWGCVLQGQLVIDGLEGAAAQDRVRAHRRRIKKTGLRTARRSTPRLSPLRFLPVGYMRLSIFDKDFRRRRLSGFGLGRNLVCTLQLQRIRRIRSPDIFGSTVETARKWRIAWNKAWLETGSSMD